MSDGNITIEKAVQDLSAIRSSLERLHTGKSGTTARPLHSSWLLLQLGAFVCAATLLVMGLLGYAQTPVLLASAYDETIRYGGLGGMAMTLVALFGATYFVIWQSARRGNESFNEHLGRYFSQLSILSFSSDLLVKFITIAAVIIALKPEWMAPLLFLFTADYLLQGRLFMLPIPQAIVLAIICLAGGAAQVYYGSAELTYPLAAFTFISGLSAYQHYMKRLKQIEAEE